MLLYYITDRTQFAGNENERQQKLLAKIAEAASCSIDFIQLREKDLSGRHLESLAATATELVRRCSQKTRMLINTRTDIALAAGADGVHLQSRDISPVDVRAIWRAAGGGSGPVTAVSCHTEEEVAAAQKARADFVVFGPVFEKYRASTVQATGMEALRSACRHQIPVLALGGVTLENAHACMQAGAAGIAAIRLFQENDIKNVVTKLRV